MSLVDILKKIQDGTATAEEVASLSKLYAQEQEYKKKAQDAFDKLIADIKKAKIDPVVLYSKLVEEGLIVIPVAAKTVAQKTVILAEPITTKTNRKGTFEIWKGRQLDKLTGDAKAYWTALQAKGKAYFVQKLEENENGKAYYATEDGKKWVNDLFPA